MNKTIRILAIETSCDETAIAVIEGDAYKKSPHFLVRSNIVSSQVAIHAEWGGVVPRIAKREHQKNLAPLLLRALKEARLLAPRKKSSMLSNSKLQILASLLDRNPELLEQFKKTIASLPIPNIDAIAVTQGPGLEPALWVGVNFARALSCVWEKPLVGINHMEGHIAVALLEQSDGKPKTQNTKHKKTIKSKTASYVLSDIRYPAIALLVSGGHTELVLIHPVRKKSLQYEIVGQTRDDAAGEAFDKVARILGLPYPGGPEISRMAEKGNHKMFPFPRPMISAPNLDFSFSGLKTSVLYTALRLKEKKLFTIKTKRDIAASFQEAVVDTLMKKTQKAIQTHKAESFILGGGVAANKELRARLQKTISDSNPKIQIYFPSPSLTGDNALMIATAAYAKILNSKKILAKKSAKTLWKTMRPHAHMKIGE